MIYRMGDCPPFDSPFNLRIWRLAMRRTTHAVAISEFVQREAISGGLPAGRVSVIYNLAPSCGEPSEARTLEPQVAGEVFRRIIYVGAVAEHKGVRQLVQAFALLRRQFPDLVLDVVGGSRYDAQFRGEVTQAEWTRLGSAVTSSCMVSRPTPLPSIGMPTFTSRPLFARKRWETLSSRRSVRVCRPSCFGREVFPRSSATAIDGVVCEEKTQEALAAGIASLLENEERRRSMGRAAREDFDARFGPERFASQWAEVFLRLPGATINPTSERS